MKKIIQTILIVAFICNISLSQEESITVNSAFVNDQVRLRWLPTMDVFEHGKEVGYTIERITIAINEVELTEQERRDSYVLLQEAFIPKSIGDMNAAVNDPNEALLADKLLNDPSTEDSLNVASSSNVSLEKALLQNQMRDNRYFFSLVLAEKNFDLACTMGLGYTDTTAETENQYIYLVTLTDALPQN